MTWYAIPLGNGTRVVAPMAPEQAQAVGATPVEPPADLAQRMAVLLKNLIDGDRRNA